MMIAAVAVRAAGKITTGKRGFSGSIFGSSFAISRSRETRSRGCWKRRLVEGPGPKRRSDRKIIKVSHGRVIAIVSLPCHRSMYGWSSSDELGIVRETSYSRGVPRGLLGVLSRNNLRLVDYRAVGGKQKSRKSFGPPDRTRSCVIRCIRGAGGC